MERLTFLQRLELAKRLASRYDVRDALEYARTENIDIGPRITFAPGPLWLYIVSFVSKAGAESVLRLSRFAETEDTDSLHAPIDGNAAALTAPPEPEFSGTMAFLSYARKDDEIDNKAITRFAAELTNQFRIQTGIDLNIFQDSGLIVGQLWRERIDRALKLASVIIPVITPNYLKSEECRRELIEFSSVEYHLGRNELILPLYYITSEEIEGIKPAADAAAVTLLLRAQRFDWREWRLKSLEAEDTRRELTRFAIQVAKVTKCLRHLDVTSQ